MKRVYLKEMPQNTSGGQIIVSLQELDFLFHLTGLKDPQEVIEHFAVICLTFYKEPQEVLKTLNISPFGGNAFFVGEGDEEPEKEPTYQRFIYEVTVKNG
jgi:hypothetical protein